MDDKTAVWLISVLGIANTVGRVGFGVLSSIPRMNAVVISNVALTVCGICTAISGLSRSVEYQFLYASAFGVTIGKWTKPSGKLLPLLYLLIVFRFSLFFIATNHSRSGSIRFGKVNQCVRITITVSRRRRHHRTPIGG